MGSEGPTPLETAKSLIDGYNTWELDAIMKPRHTSCTQKVLPARLNRPAMSNDEYRQYFQGVMGQFRDYHLEISDATEDTKRHKVAFLLQGTAKTAIGDYANEFTVIIHLTEDDSQILEVKEFVYVPCALIRADSGYSMDFFQRLRAHMAGQS
ncbi:uncharacterized protein LTR77_001042 [Saxophila tyrrhenica]|uniref:Uncharacterized protein n=1 Tax=Saxophila tyrrhenica TaxID=1690608 RepID=A0AAV9PST9_9PEZI|nr:hypothetical protein LTR77_001042 [Saxophila tyrrhenica]